MSPQLMSADMVGRVELLLVNLQERRGIGGLGLVDAILRRLALCSCPEQKAGLLAGAKEELGAILEVFWAAQYPGPRPPEGRDPQPPERKGGK